MTLPPTHSLRGVANAFGTQAKVRGFLRSPQRDMAAPPTERKGVAKTPLGRVDLLFKPEEGTDKVEKAQEVSGQFVKTRKYMSVLL